MKNIIYEQECMDNLCENYLQFWINNHLLGFGKKTKEIQILRVRVRDEYVPLRLPLQPHEVEQKSVPVC